MQTIIARDALSSAVLVVVRQVVIEAASSGV